MESGYKMVEECVRKINEKHTILKTKKCRNINEMLLL